MGKYAVWSIYISACFAILFALSNTYYLSMLFIFVVNFCIAVFHNSTSYVMFSTIDENYRGRLAGLQVSSFGLFIAGTTLSGILANMFGASISTITCMILIIVISSIIVTKYRIIYANQWINTKTLMIMCTQSNLTVSNSGNTLIL